MSSVLDCVPATDGRMLFRRQFTRLIVATVLLLICFAPPLARLVPFVLHSELFSFIVLVPFISGYLVWIDKKRLRFETAHSWPAAIACFVAAAAFLGVYEVWIGSGHKLLLEDYLAFMMAALVCSFWGLCLGFLGWKMLRQIAFAVGFLVFVVPLPTVWVASIDTFFQDTSAATAAGFCRFVGTPVLREGLILHLPAFSLRVAPECSGIHSTVVLLLTSLIAGYLFLNRFWSRAVLTLIVIPLAIVRNGFRICVVGELCVHIGPQMIDSPIHRKGGPLFFALSLIPFFLILLYLRKIEARGSKGLQKQSAT